MLTSGSTGSACCRARGLLAWENGAQGLGLTTIKMRLRMLSADPPLHANEAVPHGYARIECDAVKPSHHYLTMRWAQKPALIMTCTLSQNARLLVDGGVLSDGDVGGADIAAGAELDAVLGDADHDGVADAGQVPDDALELARRHPHPAHGSCRIKLGRVRTMESNLMYLCEGRFGNLIRAVSTKAKSKASTINAYLCPALTE